MCAYTYIHMNMHVYVHTHTHTYIHTCIHKYIHTYIHTCMHACMHACIHTYIHTHIYIYIYILAESRRLQALKYIFSPLVFLIPERFFLGGRASLPDTRVFFLFSLLVFGMPRGDAKHHSSNLRTNCPITVFFLIFVYFFFAR